MVPVHVRHAAVPLTLSVALLASCSSAPTTTKPKSSAQRGVATQETSVSTKTVSALAATAVPVSGIVTAPAGVLGSGGITFAGIISGNSGNIISANGGNIIANNASGLVSNNAGGFHTLAVEQAPVEGAEVYLADSTGRPLPGLAQVTLAGL